MDDSQEQTADAAKLKQADDDDDEMASSAGSESQSSSTEDSSTDDSDDDGESDDQSSQSDSSSNSSNDDSASSKSSNTPNDSQQQTICDQTKDGEDDDDDEHDHDKNKTAVLAHFDKPCRNNKAKQLNNSKEDFKKIYEKYPDILRRSSRSRKEPDRFQIEAHDSDDSDSNKTNRRRRKRKDSDEWSDHRASSGDDQDDHDDQQDSDDDFLSKSRTRQRSSRRVRTSRHINKSTHSQSDTDRDEDESDDDSDSDHRTRRSSTRKMTSRRSVNPVSYKEESDYTDDDTDQTNDPNHNDSMHGATAQEMEEEGEMIEKVLEDRLGRPGATGPKTASYQVDEHGDPNIGLTDDEPKEQQFLIKWKNWSYIHCTWESKQSLEEQKARGLKKIEQYLKKVEENKLWKKTASPEDIDTYEDQEELDYQVRQLHMNVERIIAHQAPKDKTTGSVEYFCKWEALPYRECTWEDGALIEKRFASKVTDYYQRNKSENIPSRSCRALKQRPKFVPMKTQPSYIGGKDQLKLRDYQLDGLNWLSQSWSRGNSVILADEMGLGKTIQTISFLNYLYHEHNVFGPFLLVVPLSTLTAWQKEFDIWAPDMNVVVFVGDATSRHTIHEYEWCHPNGQIKFNVLLTTNEILLREKQCLSAVPWAVLGMDEAHRLKNDESFLYKCLSTFDSNYRLLITGTPLQNSLRELWALLHFIMPSRFDSWESFESEHKDSYQKGFSKLHSQLQQFLLRRVKKDVEKSLPAKVEQILRVDMTSIQKQFYKWILTKNFKALSKGLRGSMNSFTNIVMELKKCCNHASLVRPYDEYSHLDPLQKLIRGSGKLLLLDKLLCRLKETGHRVLIFSQMVRMLDLLGDYLSLRRFQYQRLDGSIRGEFRKQALEHFNAEGSQDFCFLLSTRAGGLGINLATADTVIIFDSDWNPQNDLQAQARAHRIGQKNQVNIYRLVTKGSVEEDIIERAKRKMVLDHLVIQRMDTSYHTINQSLNNRSNNSSLFNKEELAAILKFGAADLFKETGENGDQDEPQCDIDEILKRAETRDDDDTPQTLGHELLNSFNVASVTFNEEEDVQAVSSAHAGNDWDDIIPESERAKFEDEQTKEQMEMIMLPRSRNKAKMIGDNRSDSGEEYDPNAKNADSPGSDDSDSERPRRRGRPKSGMKESIKGFSEQEVRRFVKSYKKFAKPLNRLESIAIDAELQEKPLPDLQWLAEQIQQQCQMAMSESQKQKEKGTASKNCRGPTFKFGGVTVFARTILTNQKDLEPLEQMLPSNPEERKKWILTGIKVRTAEWNCPWTIEDDSRLLVGVYEYGLGSWESIKMDPSLKLTDKILPDGETTPQAKHLAKRVECLLKLIKRHLDSQNQNNRSKMLKKDWSSTSNNKDNRSKMDKMNSQQDRKKKKMNSDHKTAADKHKKKHKDKKKDKKERKDKKRNVLTSEVDELSPEQFNECKELMRAVKKSIKTLNKMDDELQNKSQRKDVFYDLVATIGAHIDTCLKQYQNDSSKMREWRNNLWTFVSKFTVYPAKKLYKFYRRVKLKQTDHKSKSSSNDQMNNTGQQDARHHHHHHQSHYHHHQSGPPISSTSSGHYGRSSNHHGYRKTDTLPGSRYHPGESDRQSSNIHHSPIGPSGSLKRPDYYAQSSNSPQAKFMKHSHHHSSSRNDYNRNDYGSSSSSGGYYSWSSKHDGYRINNNMNNSYDNNNRYHSNKGYYNNNNRNSSGPPPPPPDRFDRRPPPPPPPLFNHNIQYNHRSHYNGNIGSGGHNLPPPPSSQPQQPTPPSSVILVNHHQQQPQPHSGHQAGQTSSISGLLPTTQTTTTSVTGSEPKGGPQ